MNTIRVRIVPVLVLAVLFYGMQLPLYPGQQDSLAEGIRFYNNAYFEKAVEALQAALGSGLDHEGQVQAHFYIALSSIALNRLSDARDHFQQLIELDPEFTLNEVDYPPDVVRQFREVRENYPVIYDFASLPAEFYPYRGDKPYFQFRITASDRVTIKLRDDNSTLSTETAYFQDHQLNRHDWQWQDRMLLDTRVSLEMSSEKNSYSSIFSKTIRYEVIMPERLEYTTSGFKLAGSPLREEHKWRDPDAFGFRFARIMCFFPILAGIGLTLSGLSENKTGLYLGLPMLAVGFGGVYLIKQMSEERKRVPIPANIEYNRRLKKQIAEEKKRIRVKQDIVEN